MQPAPFMYTKTYVAGLMLMSIKRPQCSDSKLQLYTIKLEANENWVIKIGSLGLNTVKPLKDFSFGIMVLKNYLKPL